MVMTTSSFLEKIFTKWWKKKEIPSLPPLTNARTWDGVSMGFPNELTVSQRKWLKLYVRLGSSRRSTNFFNRAYEEIAPFFTKEQLAEQLAVYHRRNEEHGRDEWRDLIQKHLVMNNINLTIGGR